MGDFNMPPGVSVNDIPGNRPEDVREEKFWETLDERFTEKVGKERADYFFDVIWPWVTEGHSPFMVGKKGETTYPGTNDLMVEYINVARALEGQEAFNQGQQEAEMEADEIERAMLEYELVEAGFCSKYNRARQEVLRRWKAD